MRKPQSPTLSPRPRPSGASAPWLEEGLKSIESFAHLGDNWDSNQAAAVTPDAIAGAKVLLTRLASAPEIATPMIYPTRAGNVQFEWENADRYFEIEIASPTDLTWFASDRSTRTEREGELCDISAIDELLSQYPVVQK